MWTCWTIGLSSGETHVVPIDESSFDILRSDLFDREFRHAGTAQSTASATASRKSKQNKRAEKGQLTIFRRSRMDSCIRGAKDSLTAQHGSVRCFKSTPLTSGVLLRFQTRRSAGLQGAARGAPEAWLPHVFIAAHKLTQGGVRGRLLAPTLQGPISVVSKPTFVIQEIFCSIFQDQILQNWHVFASLETQHL